VALSSSVVNTAASTAILVPAQGSGLVIYVYRLFLVAGPAGAFPNLLTFGDGVQSLSGSLYAANVGAEITEDNGNAADINSVPWFTCDANQPFIMSNPGLIQISGTVYWTTTTPTPPPAAGINEWLPIARRRNKR
jgi:hypothetical protein